MKAFGFTVFLCFLTSSAIADNLELRFEESHHLKSYRYQTFIKDGVYVQMNAQWDADSYGYSTVPDIYTLKLDDSQQSDLIDKLLEVGVADWEREYPSSEGVPAVCEKFFMFRIKSERLDVFSTGACQYPPGYDAMVKILNAINKPPNKSLNQDTGDAGAS